MPKHNRKRKNQQYQQQQQNRNNQNATKRNKQNKPQPEKQQSQGSTSNDPAEHQHGETRSDNSAVGTIGPMPNVNSNDLVKNGSADLKDQNDGATPSRSGDHQQLEDEGAKANIECDESEFDHRIDLAKTDQHDPISNVSDQSNSIEEEQRSNDRSIELVDDHSCVDSDSGVEDIKTGANESTGSSEGREDHQPLSDHAAVVELKTIEKAESVPEPPDKGDSSKEELNSTGVDSTAVEIGSEPIKDRDSCFVSDRGVEDTKTGANESTGTNEGREDHQPSSDHAAVVELETIVKAESVPEPPDKGDSSKGELNSTGVDSTAVEIGSEPIKDRDSCFVSDRGVEDSKTGANESTGGSEGREDPLPSSDHGAVVELETIVKAESVSEPPDKGDSSKEELNSTGVDSTAVEIGSEPIKDRDRGVEDTKTGANESTGSSEGREDHQPLSDHGAVVELKTIVKAESVPEPPDKGDSSKEELNVDSTAVEIGSEPIKDRTTKDRRPLEAADSVDSSATFVGSDILDNDEDDTGNLPDISDFSFDSIDNIVEGDIMRDDTQSNICDKEMNEMQNEEDPQTVPRKSSKSPSPALSTSSSATLVGEKEEMDQNVDLAEENRDTVSSGERTMTTTTTTTREIPLKHGIVQEIIQTTSTYRVESPKPIVAKTTTTTTVKKSRSLGDDIFAIQELSDCSSTSEVNDYQPVISEASESEAESEANETYELHQHPNIISIQTIPINHPDMKLELLQPTESPDDIKTRRAKKRIAIETHFMPQFLNPRYLDSIREESEHSDADRRSNDSGDLKRSPTEDDLDDDVFHSPTSPKHAVNAVYPKSHLDFSKKHQAPPLPQPSTTSIREESVRVVLEAKLFDQPLVLESCTEWQTDKIPESDAAEVIYIDSASSSSSDVVDPDDVEVIEEDQNVRIQTPTIESNQVDSLLKNSTLQQTQTGEKSNISMTSEVKTAQIERSVPQLEAPPVAREKQENQENRKNEEKKFINEALHQQNQGQHENHEECGAKTYDDHLKLDSEDRARSAPQRTDSIPKDHSVQTPPTPPSVSAINSNISGKSLPGNQQDLWIKTTAVKVQLKNIIESIESEVKRVEETVSNASSVNSDSKVTKNSSDQNSMYATVITPLIQSHDEVIRKLIEEPDPVDGSTSKDLTRQDSSGSHCSGNSQNTVINKDTTTCDLSDFDLGQCPISGSPSKQDTAARSPGSPTLRQLCLDTLASMPYGYAVLEELANVSETISDLTQIHQQQQQLQQHDHKDDMPYPLPQIPKINDLEVRMHENDAKTYARASSGKVRLVTLPPQPVAKLKSPPPPPVPEQPKMEPWLGLPTEQDPNVLVCLSPSQRNYMNESSKSGSKPADTSADNLLDMHKKFVERRGYHEYTTEQVKAATQRSDEEKSILVTTPNVTNTTKNNSQSPPPIPPPPLPRSLGQPLESKPPHSPTAPIPPPKSSSTATLAAKTLKSDDKNNHRLLAIIRDSRQPSGESGPPKEIRHEIVVEKSSDQQQNHISQQVQTEMPSVPPSVVQPPTPPTKSAETSTKMLPPLTEIEAQIRALQQLAAGKSITEEKTEIKRSETKTETKSTGSAPQAYFNKPSWHRDSFFSSLDDLRKKCEGFDRSDSSRRFSSFDGGSPFCSQIMQTMPKRYSNVEKSSFESKKRVENGNVVYDITDSKKEKVVDDGEGGVVKETSSSHTGEEPKTKPSQAAPKEDTKSSNFFTDFFKNRTSAEPPKTEPQSAPAAPSSSTGARPSSMFSFFGDQKQKTEEKTQTQNFAYDEFRERAKESARRAQSEFFDRDLFNFKDFEEPKRTFKDDFFTSTSTTEKKDEAVHKEYTIPIKVESRNEAYESKQQQKTQPKFQSEPTRGPAPEPHHREPQHREPHHREPQHREPQHREPQHREPQHREPHHREPQHREHRIPIQVEGREPPRASSVMDNRSDFYSEHKPQTQSEWMAAQRDDLGASSENITKPIQKEFEICHGRRANIRAPRLSVSTSNLTEYDSHDESTSGNMYQHHFYSPAMKRRQVSSMYEPSSPSLPQDPHADQIAMKERELQAQIEKLEHDRRRLMEEMDRVHTNQRMQRDHNQRMMQRLPTLNEEDTFRQQIQNEWLNKVAEREERRLQNIIKISKPAQDVKPQEQYEPRESYYDGSNMRKAVSAADISDEFLRRVKERRSKLCMPSDSDWESGAESQPQPSPFSEQNKVHEPPPRVKVIEGQREADFRQLPKHLREFAEFTTTRQEEHDEKTSTLRESTLVRNKDESHPAMIAPKFKAVAPPGSGVWTPHGKSDPSAEARQFANKRTIPATPPPPPPPPPVWSPQPSPQPGRKEFRPINFESPKPSRKYIQRQESDPVVPPWSYTQTKPFSSSCTNLHSFGYESRPLKTTASSSTSINSLQKAREGQIQKGVSHTEPSRPKPPKDDTPAFVRPNEVIYSIKHEYMSEPESYNERPKKMAQLGRRQFEGIGPTTKDGMPIVLRSEVKEDNQHKWYKRMYNTLHKAKDDGRYPYKTNGYMSEPEPNYDSDYSIKMKYNTLDRRRIPSTGSYDDRSYGTMPNPVKPGSSSYKNQPGRIEDYIPGHSSISEKEKKEWWDEVMEIFNGHLEQQKLSNNYAEGYLSRALKDQGYESDSHLVFRKKEESHISPLSPLQQKQAYRSVQTGGEPPLQGFRKPAPEKPKDDTDIEYVPMSSSTLTRLRVQNKTLPDTNLHQEIICYPITNISRPLDLFAPFPKNVPSFVPVHPPTPPSRESSRTSAAMKIYTSSQVTQEIPRRPTSASRHEACFQTDYFQRDSPTNKFGTITIRKHSKREPIVRSKSAGTVTASKTLTACLKEEKTRDGGGTRVSRRQQLTRVSSISPKPGQIDHRKASPSPVAFGRSISKERTFAEEKKRLEGTLPVCRKILPVSTSILRDPALRSPDEVKQAVRRSVCQPLMRSLSAPKKLSPLAESSTFSATASKNVTKTGKKEDKHMKMSLSMSSKARDYSSKVAASTTKKTSQTPTSLKSNVHASRTVEKKTPKRSVKTSSTMSLARTSSTFSVDSGGSKKKTYIPKKPLTISRSASKERSVPMTIVGTKSRKSRSVSKERVCTSKSDGNVVRKVTESQHVSMSSDAPPATAVSNIERQSERNISDSLTKHQENFRSDQFFQNLFLRDSSPAASLTSSPHPSTSVQEKAKYWDSVACRSEPSLRRANIYLAQKKPVTDSKFLSLQTQRHYQSRSLSPARRRWTSPKKDDSGYDEVYRYGSYFQLSDEESEFEERKLEEKINKFEKRSLSEPRSKFCGTESSRSRSPTVIYGKSSLEYSRTSSPTRQVRSPSRRRIQSFRDSQRMETKRVIRASSLSSADARSCGKLHESDDLPRSSSELNFIECHGSTCPYRKSERFKELSRFYSNLERVGQLERATSSTDLHPIRPEGEVIDFDLWKQLRARERAERELNYLVGKLKEDQKEKDLFFRPKDPEDLKWHNYADSGLRNKEKSVEDLREGFEKKACEEGLDEARRMEIEATKDTYKPFWRGNSVVDLASNMVCKYNPPEKSLDSEKRYEKNVAISNRLMSTLSKDQVSKIKHQLSEIYSTAPGSVDGRDRTTSVSEDYVITVDGQAKKADASLKVRCNSTISKEELLGPVLRKKEAQASVARSESTSLLPILPPRPPPQSTSFQRLSRHVQRYETDLTEGEKKRLSQSLSREIQDKVLERRRAVSPVLTPRETRGAIAAEAAKSTLPDPLPPQRYYSLEYSRSDANLDSGRFSESAVEKRVEKKVTKRPSSLVESESNTSDLSKTTVIYKEKPGSSIHNKIKYFEEKQTEEPPKTIYHAREYSSPDEDEVLKAIEEKLKSRGEETKTKLTLRHRELSSSASDFKELFGEKEVTRTNFPIPLPPPPPDESAYRSSSAVVETSATTTEIQTAPIVQSPSSSSEYIYRSRSVSPGTEKLYRAHLSRCKTGDVKKIKDKFESLNECSSINFFELSPIRRIRSDPELNKGTGSRAISPHKVTVRNHETGDVSWITHKFETKNSAAIRGRSRTRRTTSPIPKVPIRKEDRLMPHIDIISKTAALKEEMRRSISPLSSFFRKPILSGEVERLRTKFESPDRLFGQMYTSSPDISELKDISSYLTGSWIAHKYPKPRDNARSPVCPEKGPESELIKRRQKFARPSSASPPRGRLLFKSLLKPYSDIFGDQKFDPSIHRPKSRYVPEQEQQQPGDKKKQSGTRKCLITFKEVDNRIRNLSETVNIAESDVVPPPPPIKGVPLNGQSPESPRRYIEHDVNIHYKSPVRYEYKDAIPEEELVRKQAEAMKKLYQEERRRKYLQELQDMNSRRHTDNFTPTQKSPIPLNRYDDFNNDLMSPKSPGSYPKTVARALYNFQGQTARELTFKKGDIIYIRRQIDKNWYEGEHNAMIGLLPANYVEIISKDTKPTQSRKPSEGQARAKFNFSAQSAIELSLNKGELVTLTRRVDENWFEGKIANRKGIFPVSYVEVLTDIGAEEYCQTGQSKPVGAPAAHSLVTYSNQNPSLDALRTNLNNEFNNLTNGHHNPSNGILRETKSVHKTEVLHVDTSTEPVPYRALYKYRPQNNDELELHEGDIVYVLEKCDDGWYVGTSQRTGYFGTFPGNYVERI